MTPFGEGKTCGDSIFLWVKVRLRLALGTATICGHRGASSCCVDASDCYG
jgi:hypothetical protein